jgi:hypothetical protein
LPKRVWPFSVVADNPFHRLWRGGFPLGPIFWSLGVVLRSLLWGGTYILLFRHAYAFVTTGWGYALLIGWIVALLLIDFATNVVIWRSASRHPGHRAVGRTAKYAVVVMTLMAISNNYIFIARLKNLNLTRQDIGALNAALPVMVDTSTRLDSVVVRTGVIIFSYTILGPAPGDAELQATIRDIRCKPENRGLLDAFRASTSIFKNEHGQILAASTVARQDCAQP